jgi:hypothetical protein
MMSQPYVDGITDTVPHQFASSLTAGQIAAGEDTVSVSVVCPDRWFLGDFAVVTSRDGRAFAGEVEGMDVCTGEVTIRGAGQLTARATPLRGSPRPRVSAGGARSPSSTITGHRHISLYSAGRRAATSRPAPRPIPPSGPDTA